MLAELAYLLQGLQGWHLGPGQSPGGLACTILSVTLFHMRPQEQI